MEDCEIIVINNNSTDETVEVVHSYANKFPNLRLMNEEKQGLSHARNRAVKESQTNWIAFLDDDAIASPDWLTSILQFQKKNPDIKIFGGPYYPYFLEKKPFWLPQKLCKNAYGPESFEIENSMRRISGGNMILHRDVFEDIGFFNHTLGMKGDQAGWGEETEWFERAKAKGWKINYVGSIEIRHLVHPRKCNLSWQIRTQIERGRCFQRSRPNAKEIKFRDLVRSLLGFLYRSTLLFLGKLLRRRQEPLFENIFLHLFSWLNVVGRYQYCEQRRKLMEILPKFRGS